MTIDPYLSDYVRDYANGIGPKPSADAPPKVSVLRVVVVSAIVWGSVFIVMAPVVAFWLWIFLKSFH